jgi:hypothetical protein
MVATSSPAISGTVLAAATSIASPVATASPSTSAAPSSSGMSGGAKAGLALGILLAIGALLGGVLFVYHRKKKQMAQSKLDSEKAAMENMPPPPPPVETAPSIRTQRTMSTAPRLSLRPVTQFSPTFGENRKSAGNLLAVTAAGSQPNERALSPDQPSSPWERPGASSAAGSAHNPFNDPVSRSVSPPANPFDNAAAIETPQATVPNTPQVTTPNTHLNDFANPAPAIAAAEAAPVVAAAAVPRKEVPAPGPTPTQAPLPAPPMLQSDMGPPSPAWTDDLPASPGPAPTGPPPVAVAGGPTNGPVPAPNNVHRVQLDFKPSMQDELELRAGQLVRMLHEYDDGWVC